MLIGMWLLLIQPQRRRQQQQARLISELAVGDEVVTVGGLYGRVQGVEEDAFTLEIAPQTSVRVTKTSVAAKVPPKAAESPAPLP
jgi:preprotein translocase subunit YajC